jgi:hypothetical protein
LRVDILPNVGHFSVSNGHGEDPIVLERLVRGFDSSRDDGRKDFYTLTEKGLDLIPVVLNIILWSAKHDSKSYVRRAKEFLARLSRSPVQTSEKVKALVRNGGCLFPESKV